MKDVVRDLTFSLRLLTRTPGLSLLAVATLALGLGANVAIFSLVDAVLFRPFPVESPEELVRIYSFSTEDDVTPGLGESSYPDFVDYREQSDVLEGLTLSFQMAFSLTSAGGEGGAERVWGEIVDGDYFDVLGAPLALGRGFTRQEAVSGDGVLVLSDALFKRRFASDPRVLGTTLRASGKNYTVIGVAPAGFHGVDLDLGVTTPPDIWIPIEPLLDETALWPFEKREARALQLVGRLAAGIDFERARAAIETRAEQLALAYPDTNRGVSVKVYPLEQARFSPIHRSSVVSFLGLLCTGVGFVLLMACSNVAALLLIPPCVRVVVACPTQRGKL